jgi:starvation-inducible DNA-binding protein
MIGRPRIDRRSLTQERLDPSWEDSEMATDRKAKARQFRTHVNIPAERRTQLIELLNQSLANVFDLYSQTKQAHWNVKGEEFYQLHELFDEIAGELIGFVDEIAERAVALGGTAMGTARMAAAHSALPEYPLDAVDGLTHVTLLVERFGTFASHVRESIEKADELGDKLTSDLYTEVGRDVDKRLWFLEAHVQDSE